MRKSELKFIIGTLIFVFGLLNIIPTEVSVYDKQIIPFIEEKTTPENTFYPHITVIILICRILIIIVTALEGWGVFSYGLRYNVFGLRDQLYE